MYNDSFIEAKLISLKNNVEYYESMIDASTNPHETMYYEQLLNCERSNLEYYKSLSPGKENMGRSPRQAKHSYSQTNQEDNVNHAGMQMPLSIAQEQPVQNSSGVRVFTMEELAEFDGSKGKPAYVAIQGIVYDVSLEPTWGGGTHFSLFAGKELTDFYLGCHQGNLGAVKNLPVVGRL